MHHFTYSEEDGDNDAAETESLNKVLSQLLYIHHYRYKKAELAWLKNRKKLKDTEDRVTRLDFILRQRNEENRICSEEMNKENINKPLTLSRLRSWFEQEKALKQLSQHDLERLNEQKERYADRQEEVSRHHLAMLDRKKTKTKQTVCVN